MDLLIKYQNGEMVVHLEEFLGCHSITKVRRLLKIISQSYTPELTEKIKIFIEQEMEDYESLQKEDANRIVDYVERVKLYERRYEGVLFSRNRFKKNSDGWKHYNEQVKQVRQGLQEVKVLLNSSNRRFRKRVKDKQFYMKCLEIMA